MMGVAIGGESVRARDVERGETRERARERGDASDATRATRRRDARAR
jgi:hypothetical protein